MLKYKVGDELIYKHPHDNTLYLAKVNTVTPTSSTPYGVRIVWNDGVTHDGKIQKAGWTCLFVEENRLSQFAVEDQEVTYA